MGYKVSKSYNVNMMMCCDHMWESMYMVYYCACYNT